MAFSTLPNIGMGTFRLKGNDARDAVKSALSLGYRHIDTAQMYGNEAEVGDGITSSGIPRREIFLTTKVWHDQLQHSDLINSLHDSLSRLKTDHVDLTLIHWPSPGDAIPNSVVGARTDLDAPNSRLTKELAPAQRSPIAPGAEERGEHFSWRLSTSSVRVCNSLSGAAEMAVIMLYRCPPSTAPLSSRLRSSTTHIGGA